MIRAVPIAPSIGPCVGIGNTPQKAALLEHAPAGTTTVAAGDAAWDCVRHREFLEALAAGADDFERTLYWKYLVWRGRSPEAARARCDRFARLYRDVCRAGYDPERGTVAVTLDGMRLDGSHRAAVAQAVGVPEVAARVYAWEACFSERRVRHIREEARLKRAGMPLVGAVVEETGSGRRLGRVRFVDVARTRAVPWRSALELVVVVEDAAGALRAHRAAATRRS